MANLIAGILSLAIALGFLAILAYAVPSVPLWIVLAIGFVMMVASVAETWRGDQQR